MLKIFRNIFSKIKEIKPMVGDIGLVNVKPEFNTDIKGELKAADNIHTQIGGTTEYNDNSQQIVQQNFAITVLPKLNVDESIKQALALGNENARLIGMDVQKILKDHNISEQYIQEKLKNPEVLSTIAKANEIAYTTNDIQKRKMLSDFIYQKFISDDEDESNTISQAIRIMKNLTKNHLKIIAFLYLFQSNYVKNNTNTSTFIEFYNKYISNLIDFSNDKLQELGMTVISNGLAVTFTLGWEINSFLPNNFYDALTGKIININPALTSIINHLNFTWKQIGTSSAKLTAVGKCIARTYLHDILDLDVIDSTDTQQVEVPTKEDIVTHDDLGEIFESAKITPYENIVTYEEIKEDK